MNYGELMIRRRIIAGKDKRTIAHKLGHSAGLSHVGLPKDMNNVMMQSWRIQVKIHLKHFF